MSHHPLMNFPLKLQPTFLTSLIQNEQYKALIILVVAKIFYLA